MKLLLLLISILISTIAFSQNTDIIIEYDAAGNRILRKTPGGTPMRLSNTPTEEEISAIEEDFEALYQSEAVKVYPNPFKDGVVVLFQELGDYNIQLFDATGKLVKQSLGNSTFIQVYTGELPSGWYNINITNGEVVVLNKKLIKLK